VAFELPLGHAVEALGTPYMLFVVILLLSTLPLVHGGKPGGSLGSKFHGFLAVAFALEVGHVLFEQGRGLPVVGRLYFVGVHVVGLTINIAREILGTDSAM
jgi:hypothetical protein